MADKVELTVQVNGVERSISTVKDAKKAIKELQDVAESSDFGSAQYKDAIEQLEKLSDSLNDVTKSEKEAAKAIEETAKAEKEAIKETQDLRKQFEVLEDRLFLLAGQGKQNTKEFHDLTIEAAALNKKIDAVNQSLGGNETERAALGFSKLNEGLRNLDFKSVKEGLAAMRTALAAVGIGLIVQLVAYLVENFDSLSQGSGIVAKALRAVGDVISYCTDKIAEFTDWLGLTNTALDKQGEAIKANADKAKEAISEQTAEYDRQIAVAKAAGKSAVDLEIAKQEAIIQTNKAIADQIVAFVRAGGTLTEEQQKIFDESINNIKNAKNQEKVITITTEKEITDKQKTELEKRAAEHKAYLEKLRQQWLDYQLNRDLDQAAYEEKNKSFAEQVKASEQADLDNKRFLEQQARDNEDLARHEKAEKDQAARDEDLQRKKEGLDTGLALTAAALQSEQQLVDAFFEFKRQGLQKGSKEDLKAAENQFKIQKALAIQTAIISGIQGVVNALSAQSVVPEPFGTVLKVATAVGVGIAAAVNVAKIASQKFNPGTSSGGGGGGAAATIPIPAPPTISTPQADVSGTNFDENGKKVTNDTTTTAPTVNVNVKAEVVESEMTDKQDRAEQLKNQATF